MRILLINYEYPPVGAGAARACEAIARVIKAEGGAPVVLTSGFNGKCGVSEEQGVTVVRVNSYRPNRDRSGFKEKISFLCHAMRNCVEVATKYTIDGCIVFFSLPCGPVASHLHGKLSIPYVISLRGGDVPGLVPAIQWQHKLLAGIRRKIMAGASAIVANDDELATLSMRSDPFPVVVIPNGVDADYFCPKSAKDEAGVFNLLFCGRFTPQKNLFALLHQFHRIRQEQGLVIHLNMVGDGPLAGDLKGMSLALGIDEAVTWHGWLSKDALLKVMQSCSCFVNPSHYEGMPNAVLEAMSCGLPVIASNIPSHMRMISSCGVIFDLADPDRLGDSIARLACDSLLCVKMGEASRASVVRNYSWSSTGRRYLDLLRGMS